MLSATPPLLPYRVGLGTDCHRLQAGLPLVLAGITFPGASYGCVAHSDGDALTHALMDALLGAVGMGDIGEYFPPSQAQWHQANSLSLLEEVLRRIKAQYPAFAVVNVDAVVHLQSLAVTPHKAAMRHCWAHALGLPLEHINIKAKTGEGLPPVGTHEAVETQVVVLVSL
jgi:2-C-methyl-D-erythritol 2,4-cyclodiphosphate synthase